MRIGVLIIVLLVGAQARDPGRAGDRVYARVVGRVVAADTGRPVARAAVTILRLNERTPMQVTSTDDEGRFVLDSVLAGRYTVLASKPGIFAETAYGQSTPHTPERVLTVKAGDETPIEIAVLRGAVIAGRLFDHTGEPMALADVVLSATDVGPHTSSLSLRATTNDRGEYRLFGLRAGEYILSATAPRLRNDSRQFAPIYFPGVSDIASAARIQLVPGQEIANADFTLRLISTVTVSGVAVGPDGQPLPGGSLAVYLAGPDGRILPRPLLTGALARFDGLSGVGSIKHDGTFSIDVMPGQYILRGRYDSRAVPDDAVRYRGALMVAQILSVGDSDLSNLLLKFSQGAALKGRFVFEGPAPARPQVFRVTVETGEPGAFAGASAEADGTFTISGIESGSRRIHAIGPGDWVLKGIYLNGRDVADRAIEFGEDTVTADASVVFTATRTPLTVTVEGTKPESLVTVLVFPEDSSLWHAASRRTVARVADAGGAVFDQLPPGDYLVVAIADVSPDALRPGDVRLLEQLRAIAQKARLVDRTPSSIRVPVQAMPK